MDVYDKIKQSGWKGAVLDLEPVNGKTEEDRLRDEVALLKQQKADDRCYIIRLEKELARQKDMFQDLLDDMRAALDEAETVARDEFT